MYNRMAILKNEFPERWKRKKHNWKLNINVLEIGIDKYHLHLHYY